MKKFNLNNMFIVYIYILSQCFSLMVKVLLYKFIETWFEFLNNVKNTNNPNGVMNNHL